MLERQLEMDAFLPANKGETRRLLLCHSEFVNPLKKHQVNVVHFEEYDLSGMSEEGKKKTSFLVEVTDMTEAGNVIYQERVERAIDDAVEVRSSQFRFRIVCLSSLEKDESMSLKLLVRVKEKRQPGGYDHIRHPLPSGSLLKGEERKIA